VALLMEEILAHKDEMFYFIQSYYRSFMKGKKIAQYKMFELWE
jgi:CRISPR-associated protein Cas1